MKTKILKLSNMRKIILLLLIAIPIITFAQEKVTWDYPIKPGSEEWKLFQSSKEMVDACQIPNDILKSVSTDELLNICLKYPMFLDVHFSNNLQDGLDAIISSFNGFETFFEREDCSETLLRLYFKEIPTKPHIKKGNNKLKVLYLELLLSQSSIINGLNEEQKKKLLKNTLKRISEKQEKKYSQYYQLSSALILSRLIDSSSLKDELNRDTWLVKFNKKGNLIDSVKVASLIEIANKL